MRVRRNFKTQEEAAAEKAVLEIKAPQLASKVGFDPLPEDQVREAEAAWAKNIGMALKAGALRDGSLRA